MHLITNIYGQIDIGTSNGFKHWNIDLFQTKKTKRNIDIIKKTGKKVLKWERLCNILLHKTMGREMKRILTQWNCWFKG